MFDIGRFKSVINKHGGFSRTNLFVVELHSSNSRSSEMTDSDLRFFCKNVTWPGININVFEYRPNAFGLPQNMPSGIISETVNGVFMLDDKHRVLSFFHEWMQAVVNYDTSKSNFAPNQSDSTQYAYEIGYKKEYSLTMVIKYFSASNPGEYYECILYDVYPTQISSINLSWEDSAQVANISVNFSYSGFKMTGSKTGDVSTDTNRGLLGSDFFTSAGENVVQSTRRPSISQAIEAITRVKPFNLIRNV